MIGHYPIARLASPCRETAVFKPNHLPSHDCKTPEDRISLGNDRDHLNGAPVENVSKWHFRAIAHHKTTATLFANVWTTCFFLRPRQQCWGSFFLWGRCFPPTDQPLAG